MINQRRFAPRGGRITPESVAGMTGICNFTASYHEVDKAFKKRGRINALFKQY